ncbi:hypothetical protein RYX36_033568 [Vicia faba]
MWWVSQGDMLSSSWQRLSTIVFTLVLQGILKAVVVAIIKDMLRAAPLDLTVHFSLENVFVQYCLLRDVLMSGIPDLGVTLLSKMRNFGQLGWYYLFCLSVPWGVGPIAPLVLGGSLIGHVSYWGVGPIALLVLGGSLTGHVSYWEGYEAKYRRVMKQNLAPTRREILRDEKLPDKSPLVISSSINEIEELVSDECEDLAEDKCDMISYSISKNIGFPMVKA